MPININDIPDLNMNVSWDNITKMTKESKKSNEAKAVLSSKSDLEKFLWHNSNEYDNKIKVTYSTIIRKLILPKTLSEGTRRIPYKLVDIQHIYRDNETDYYEFIIMKEDKYYSVYIEVNLKNIELLETTAEFSLTERDQICIVTTDNLETLTIELEAPIGTVLIEFGLKTLSEQYFKKAKTTISHNNQNININYYVLDGSVGQ